MADVANLETYRTALRNGDSATATSLRKSFTAESIKAEGNRSYTFTISTGSIDRDRDRIAVEGWKTESFLAAGGPVLWAHQYDALPIGKAVWVRASAGSLKARVEFAPPEISPFAESVRQHIEFGSLRAASVGFRPLTGKAAWNEERSGIDFLEQELLEFSIVPVPSNPEALLDAKAAAIDTAPIGDWCLKYLQGVAPGVWLTADQAAALLDNRNAAWAKAIDLLRAIDKRGRVINAANEAKLRGARGYSDEICRALDDVLAQVTAEAEEDGEEGKAAPAPAAAPAVLTLVPAPQAKTYLVNPAAIEAATEAAVSKIVRAQINAARGRLD